MGAPTPTPTPTPRPGGRPTPQPQATPTPPRPLTEPQVDYAGIAQAFDAVKKRWGLRDVQLQFSPRLWIDKPGGQEAAAWYNPANKTVSINVPSLQDVAKQIPAQDWSQYQHGLHDAMMIYMQRVMDHELSHGLQHQEISGMTKRSYEQGIAPLASPEGYPHDVRQTQRTVVMNREELFPLMNRLARNRFEEDDPRLAGAPELYPSFFGNSPWQYGHPPNSIFPDPFGPPQPQGGLTSIGGRGAS